MAFNQLKFQLASYLVNKKRNFHYRTNSGSRTSLFLFSIVNEKEFKRFVEYFDLISALGSHYECLVVTNDSFYRKLSTRHLHSHIINEKQINFLGMLKSGNVNLSKTYHAIINMNEGSDSSISIHNCASAISSKLKVNLGQDNKFRFYNLMLDTHNLLIPKEILNFIIQSLNKIY